jgi:hypothetical protein
MNKVFRGVAIQLSGGLLPVSVSSTPGELEHGSSDRPAAVSRQGHRRETRPQHPHQAEPEADDDHRRVLAVITFLDAR